MQRFGTDDAGFAIASEDGAAVVRVQAWGFWGAELGTTFVRTVIAACRTPKRSFSIVIDATKLKPQREEGQGAFRAMMAAMVALTPSHATLIVGNALTKMQLVRLAQENDALAWDFTVPGMAPA